MKKVWFYSLGLIAIVLLLACAGPTATPVPKPTPTPVPLAATPTPSPLLKAKAEAEAKGFIFETSHDEILAKAKAEGKLRVLSSLDPGCYPVMAKAFQQKYPFIDTYAEEITGTEAEQRALLEMKAGTMKNWDIVHNTYDFYNEYIPYNKKFDILGMAQQGVLAIDPRMVDANNRNVVAEGVFVFAIAYNKNLIDPAKVPDTWEGFLAPELKGRKFLMDIRPKGQPELIPLMGEAWVLDWARKIAAQQPVWIRGQTMGMTRMAAGEYSLFAMLQTNTIKRAIDNDPTRALQFKIVEPVPVRLAEPESVLGAAPHPYAGLLWLEFSSSPEGQRILDESEPWKASLYYPGSVTAEMIKGKKVSVVDWNYYPKIQEWTAKVVEAFGFPSAQVK